MKKIIFLLIGSSLTCCLFLVLAIGSTELEEIGGLPPDRHVVYEPEGGYLTPAYYEETISGTAAQGTKYQTTKKGPRDEEGRWHGHVFTQHEYAPSMERETEVGEYVHGLRHGKFVRKFSSDVNVEMCFDKGVLVGCQKAIKPSEDTPTAFQILRDKYVWHLYNLQFMEIEEAQVEELMNAIESELARNEFQATEFDDRYNAAIDTCSKNEAYKIIINYNNLLSTQESIDMIRGNEFRLAVLQHQRSANKSTYDILNSTHPGYKNLMLQAGASEDTLKIFCDNLDARMALGEALDPEDPFFTDSVDQRLATSLFGMMFEEKVYPELLLIGKNMLYSGEYYLIHAVKGILESRLNKAAAGLSPQELSFVVFYTVLIETYKCDAIRLAVRDASFYDHTRLAVVTTSASAVHTDQGVMLTGNVIEDGGAGVTQRGIAWSNTYNPTTDNNTAAAGSGIGKFSITLTGLREDETYYARAYATNSVGTAYGNLIRFSADQATGSSDVETTDRLVSAYPIPARHHLYIALENMPGETSYVSLMNLKGQQLRSHTTNIPGRHEVSLNIEGLEPGVYILAVNQQGQTLNRKVIIE